MGVGVALVVFALLSALLGVVSTYTFNYTQPTVDVDLSQAVKSALYLTKETLSDDPNWGDCSGADQNCSDTDSYGYFPLYSLALQKTLKDYDLGGVKATVKVKFPDSDTADVIVVAQKGSAKRYFGVVFQRGGGKAKIPLVYAPYSRVYGGKVCSWFWDGSRLKGITKPNFVVFLNSDFYWSPEIVDPSSPTGDNPKDVVFATNFDTEVKGYKEIDKVYTTGDLYLEDGAYLKLAYANGKVYTDSDSGADKIVENGSFDYPDFNDDIPDNNVNTSNLYGSSDFFCWRGTKVITGVHYYNRFTVIRCNVKLVNAKVYVRDYFDYRSTITFQNSELYVANKFTSYNSILNQDDSKLDVKQLYTYNSELHWSGNSDLEIDDATFNKFTVYPDSLFHPKINTLEFQNFNDCTNPVYCLWDANDITVDDYGGVVGTILARDYMETGYDSQVIGNTFAEQLKATYSEFCNIVDSSGNQIIADQQNFYSIVAPDGISFPEGVAEIYRVICSDEGDCDSKFPE